MVRKAARIEISPMTEERRRQLREALDAAREFSDQLLAKRGGRLFGPVSDDLAAIREGRDEDEAYE
jgi:hypothetical protein